MRYLALMLFFLGTTVAAEIVEPETETKYADTIEVAGKTLHCTGVGVRQVYWVDVYGIAHYGLSDSGPKADAPAEEKLAHWINSTEPKAMLIQFVYPADEGNMRQFSEKSLEAAGYPEEKREKFLEAFARDYDTGSRVLLASEGKEKLSVTINEEAPLTWDDAELVSALWKCWLGEKSVLKKREALVTLPGK